VYATLLDSPSRDFGTQNVCLISLQHKPKALCDLVEFVNHFPKGFLRIGSGHAFYIQEGVKPQVFHYISIPIVMILVV